MGHGCRSTTFVVIGLAVMTAPLSTLAQTQKYPAKPIRFIIPYPPGGASDVTARIIGQKMTENWGQQVVIDNRPGANGIIACDIAAKSTPDGHTILMANVGPNAINQAVYAKLPYDSEKSFTPITLTSIVPQVLVTGATSGVADLKTLIAQAKAKPGFLRYASGGTGASNHLSGELLQFMAGIKMIHVPYKGDAPSLVDVMANQVIAAMPTAIAVVPHVKAGRIKALGVSPRKRVAALPDVPTIEEAGIPGFESVSWGGVMAPAGAPAPVVSALHQEIVRIIRLPDVTEKLQALGADIVGSSPPEFAQYVKSEIKKWGDVAKRANVRLD